MRYLITVKLNDGTFIRLISEFSQTNFRSERASEVLTSVLQQIYTLDESFQVRSIWTFVPQIAQQKLKEFIEKRPH